jgi:hypothetical protein
MADERLDDLERRVRELEARVAGLRDEQAALEDAVIAAGGRTSAAGEDPERDAAAWTDPARRSAGNAEGDEPGTDEQERAMAPPTGATQAAVEEAVDEVERARDHEENLVM